MKFKDFTKLYLSLIILLLVLIFQKDFGILYYFTKPLLMVSLAAFYWQHNGRNQLPNSGFVALALLLSLAGDVFLMLPETGWPFLAGMLAFGLAHLAYLVFHQTYFKMEKALFTSSLILMAVLVYVVLSQLNIAAGLRIPVYIYGLLLSLHFCVALVNRKSLGWWPFLGITLFLISDILLAYNHFDEPLVYRSMAVILLYALGQLLIVYGILHRPGITPKEDIL